MQPKKKILIVDDDNAHRTMLNTLLEWHYEVCEAENGAVAIEAIQHQTFDLVLMDVRMPKVSGLAALERISNLAPGLPVIMMTAYSSKETAENALRKGARDWLIKPFDFDVLMRKIEEAVAGGCTALKPAAGNTGQ